MKRILITGAGGSPAVNFTRSLRQTAEDFYLVGTDANKYYLLRAEVDSRYLVPVAQDPYYLKALNRIIQDENIEFVHAQNDTEVRFLSENREKINAKLFLPNKKTIKICQDKFLSFKKWDSAGIKVPRTVIIKSEQDVKNALKNFGGKMWIRANTGAGGRGSLPVNDFKTAKNWLDFQNGWGGDFSASELLKPQTVTWMSIWYKGELVVAQGRQRLYWELSKISPSGVTGATGTGVTYSDDELDDIAFKAVRAIDNEPHGLFGVDMAYDGNGTPNPTEINIGRFFTTHQFFTEVGLNMPYIFVQLAYGEKPGLPEKKTNPLPDGKLWVRGLDFEPVLSSVEDVEEYVKKWKAIKKELQA